MIRPRQENLALRQCVLDRLLHRKPFPQRGFIAKRYRTVKKKEGGVRLRTARFVAERARSEVLGRCAQVEQSEASPEKGVKRITERPSWAGGSR